jgi:molecular chaperone HscB
MTCWHCSLPVDGLFCGFCSTLQSPPSDYFEVFGLESRLALDTADLQKRFYALSRQVHPDRYTQKTDQERACSLEATAVLNDAFRTLRDPVSRAEYVLKKQGFDIGEQRSKDVPPELLEEVFDLNLALEELRSGDDDARTQLEEAERRFLAMRGEIDAQLEQLFVRYDLARDREVLAEIRGVLNRRRYISNLVGEVHKALESGAAQPQSR